MSSKDLITELDRIDANRSSQWLASLDERKLKELEFHDKDRDSEVLVDLSQDDYERLHGNKKYYATTRLSVDYLEQWTEANARGKVFLDYACGNGEGARRAARAGASLAIGIDISDISVQNAARVAEQEGLANIRFLQADCENTLLPDSSVDAVLCCGMLHHLDLAHAYPELLRVLKPGGRILAYEALNYNPIIKLYRRFTPQMRTEWEREHILSYKDLRFASNYFSVENVRHWHLFSILGVRMPFMLPLLDALDRAVLRLPLVKLMSWIFTFELVKEDAEPHRSTGMPS